MTKLGCTHATLPLSQLTQARLKFECHLSMRRLSTTLRSRKGAINSCISAPHWAKSCAVVTWTPAWGAYKCPREWSLQEKYNILPNICRHPCNNCQDCILCERILHTRIWCNNISQTQHCIWLLLYKNRVQHYLARTALWLAPIWTTDVNQTLLGNR